VEQARVDAQTRLDLRATGQEVRRELSEADRLEQEARDRAEQERASAEAAEQAAARARADAERLAFQTR
jgi:hypothetical protein